MNTFSKNLRQAMNEQGITQTELSLKTGIGKSSVSQYLAGKNLPNPARLQTIADALNVTIPWLTGDTGEVETSRVMIRNVPIETAAKLMGIGKQMLRQGLKNGDFPFGRAVLMASSKYRYYISPSKFTEYTGIEI